MSFLKNLNWRFATKKFDSDKKVSEKDIKQICEAIQLSPSSYGLQTWHVYVVSDIEIKKKMHKVAFMQSQIIDAPYILVFCGRNDVMQRIDNYGDLNIKKNILDAVKMKGIQTFMKSSMMGKSKEHLMNWAQHQAYLALGFALAACCELKIDSCPMEGFNNVKMDKLLKIPPYMNSVVMLAIGHRKNDPSHAKMRFPKEDLFTFV